MPNHPENSEVILLDEKNEVVVALVVVLFTAVKFLKVDWLVTPVPVAFNCVNCPIIPKVLLANSFVAVAWVPVALVNVNCWNDESAVVEVAM